MTRTNAAIGAFALTACTFLSACTGSERVADDGQVVVDATNLKSGGAEQTLVFGNDCKNQSDVYMVGIAAKSDSKVFTSKEEFASKIRLYDGRKGSSTSVKISVEDEPEHLDNLWAGYQADRAANPGVDAHKVDIVLYGSDVQEDKGGYDGRINGGLRSCAFLAYAHGTLR